MSDSAGGGVIGDSDVSIAVIASASGLLLGNDDDATPTQAQPISATFFTNEILHKQPTES